MKKILIILGMASALAVFAAACNHSETSTAPVTAAETTTTAAETTTTTTGGTTATTAGSQIDCNSVDLESTEIGISSTKIKVLVSADVGSPLAPGLFQGNFDGTNAWADYINDNGGLECRKIYFIENDSKLNPQETTNGFLRACEDALAMVGSSSLFVPDIEPLNTCKDKEGDPTGIPDFAERANEQRHGCSVNVFHMSGNINACPPKPGKAQLYAANIGMMQWLHKNIAPQTDDKALHGVWAIPGDLPGTRISGIPSLRIYHRQIGIKNDGEFFVSGRWTQAQYGALLSEMKSKKSNFGRTGSSDNSLLKWRSEANSQGGFEDVIWACPLSCYTKNFKETDTKITEGTYLWMSLLPYEERDTNTELDLFLTSVGDDFPPIWAAGAWAAGRLFEQVINAVVDEYGVNGITRARILAEAKKVQSFNANDWWGAISFEKKANSQPNISECFVILQVKSGEFVRVHPEERGTLDCSPSNYREITIVAEDEVENGPSPEDMYGG